MGNLQQALPRGRHLVAPRTFTQEHGLLFEVGFGALPAFLEHHIPGAAYLDTGTFETPPLWNVIADAALTALLLRLGVRHDTTVILYGRNNLAAARAAHVMLYAGVADVRLLDGGYQAWSLLGLPAESGPGRTPVPVDDFGIPVPARPRYLVDLAAARSLHTTDAAALVSMRTWNEFTGRTSGYAYIDARGEIPGALWGRTHFDACVNSMSELHRPDGAMAAPHTILAIWQAAGLDPARRTVFYCGTGWRASLAFYYAWLMGWDDIGVFDGGWFEWSSDPANPVCCQAGAMLVA